MEKLEKEEKKVFRPILKAATNLLILVAAVLFLVNYMFDAVRMESVSMDPTMGQGSIAFVNHLWYRTAKPKRFEVAAYYGEDGRIQVKRIIGLPGEVVQIIDRRIYVDGKPLAGVPASMETIDIAGRANEPVTLGADEYFVLGDNPARSQDSRFSGTGNVTRDRFAGRVWFFWESLVRFGFL